MPTRERRLAALFALTFFIVLGAFLFLGIDLEGTIRGEGWLPKVVFGLMVVTEVILAPIPGGVISFVGAATLGLAVAWPILFVGNVVGSTAAFLIARHLGRDFVLRHLDTEKLRRYERFLTRHPATLWIVYSLPVFPIDLVSLLLGLSRIPLRRFLLTILAGLWLYTGIVAVVGARFGRYVPALETVAVALLAAFLVVLVAFVWSLRKKPVSR